MLYRDTVIQQGRSYRGQVRAEGIYGTPPAELAEAPAGAIQFSPLMPGSAAWRSRPKARSASMVVLAPPGTVERRYVIALALQALAPGGCLTVLAPKDKGGCAHRQGAQGLRLRGQRDLPPPSPHLRRGRPRASAASTKPSPRARRGSWRLGLWSQPGVFSWNRIDPGSALARAASARPVRPRRGFRLRHRHLSRAILRSPKVEHLTLIDIDRRAVEMAARNIARSARRDALGDVRGDADVLPASISW